MISLAVIAYNSEKTLQACLSSANDLVNEIIVVIDSRTNDFTEKIAKDCGAKTVVREFANFSEQKNYATSLCKNNWILSLDSDEVLTPSLVSEIQALQLNSQCYSIPRLNHFFGIPVYHTNWSPEEDRQVRLYDKKYCNWKNTVHERVYSSKAPVKLKNFINHYPYNDVTEFVSKTNKYTSLENKYTFPAFEFIKRYLLHQGIRDGYLGLFLSYLMAIYHLTSHVKLWLKTGK